MELWFIWKKKHAWTVCVSLNKHGGQQRQSHSSPDHGCSDTTFRKGSPCLYQVKTGHHMANFPFWSPWKISVTRHWRCDWSKLCKSRKSKGGVDPSPVILGAVDASCRAAATNGNERSVSQCCAWRQSGHMPEMLGAKADTYLTCN